MFFQILLNKVVKILGKWYYQVGNIKQCGNTEQSYLFHENSMNSVHNSHVASCLWFRSVIEGLCPTQPKSLHNLLPSFFLAKQQFSTEQNWCFEMKLWSKVNFRRNIYLICTCPRLLLFWQEKFYEIWGKFF